MIGGSNDTINDPVSAAGCKGVGIEYEIAGRGDLQVATVRLNFTAFLCTRSNEEVRTSQQDITSGINSTGGQQQDASHSIAV